MLPTRGPASRRGTWSFGIPSPAGPPLRRKGIVSGVADGRQTCPALQGQAQSLSSEALSQPCEHPEGRSDPKPPAPARPTRGKSRRPVCSPSNVLLPSVSAASWTPWLPHGGEGRVTTASQGAVSSHCRRGTFRSLFHSGTVTAMFEMVAVRPAWVLVTTRSRALS